MLDSGLKIPESIVREAKLHMQKVYNKTFPPKFSFEKMAHDALNPQRACQQLDLFFAKVGKPQQGDSFLEIGSGYGYLVLTAGKLYDLEAHGLEPQDHQFNGTVEISQKLLEANGYDPKRIHIGFGENIPLPDNKFDYVFSSSVLEHVQDPIRVVTEAVRVAKPGGYVQIVFPNFGSFWEGHYGIFWIPFLPKKLGELYVRLLGRDLEMMQSLRLLDIRDVRKIIRALDGKAQLLGLGQDVFAQRMRTLDVPKWASLPTLAKWLRMANQLGAVEVLIKIGRRFHWETPFILTFKKMIVVNNDKTR